MPINPEISELFFLIETTSYFGSVAPGSAGSDAGLMLGKGVCCARTCGSASTARQTAVGMPAWRSFIAADPLMFQTILEGDGKFVERYWKQSRAMGTMRCCDLLAEALTEPETFASAAKAAFLLWSYGRVEACPLQNDTYIKARLNQSAAKLVN
jgi:hypothetical protein